MIELDYFRESIPPDETPSSAESINWYAVGETVNEALFFVLF